MYCDTHHVVYRDISSTSSHRPALRTLFTFAHGRLWWKKVTRCAVSTPGDIYLLSHYVLTALWQRERTSAGQSDFCAWAFAMQSFRPEHLGLRYKSDLPCCRNKSFSWVVFLDSGVAGRKQYAVNSMQENATVKVMMLFTRHASGSASAWCMLGK